MNRLQSIVMLATAAMLGGCSVSAEGTSEQAGHVADSGAQATHVAVPGKSAEVPPIRDASAPAYVTCQYDGGKVCPLLYALAYPAGVRGVRLVLSANGFGCGDHPADAVEAIQPGNELAYRVPAEASITWPGVDITYGTVELGEDARGVDGRIRFSAYVGYEIDVHGIPVCSASGKL